MTGPFRAGIEGSHGMTWIMHNLRPLLHLNQQENKYDVTSSAE